MCEFWLLPPRVFARIPISLWHGAPPVEVGAQVVGVVAMLMNDG
jgi:hypothetical protein